LNRTWIVAASIVCVASSAAAQPTEGDKGSAKALLQSGLKLFAAKDYLGALAVFRDAYARFPSGKILLNIGTTLVKLDRPAEAANAYQRYLDSPDADAAKKDEALRVLADLDKKVAVLEVTVVPANAEVQLGTEDWRPAADVKRTRVMPGESTITARRNDYKPAARVVTARAGGSVTASLTLELVPIAITTTPTDTGGGGTSSTTSIGATFDRNQPSRFGAIVLAHIDPSNQGAAGVAGVTAGVHERVQVRAAAILGPYFGGYVGGSFAVLTGRVRPIVAVAMPVFRSEGWRVAVRGAGGVEVQLNRHITVIGELGVEHLFNPEDSVDSPTLFIPALGVTARL
jgi:hypothetical protein